MPISAPETAATRTTSATTTTPAPSDPVAAAGVVDDIIEVPDEQTGTQKTHSTSDGATGTTSTIPSTKSSKKTAANTSDSSISASKTTVEKIWVTVLSVTSTTSDDVNTSMTKARVSTFISSINDYWHTESEGAVTVELAGFETLSVDEKECTPRELFTTVPVKAFDGRFAKNTWKGTHDHLAMLSVEGCGRTGLGTIGGDGGIMFSGNGIGTDLGVPVLAHEFGHNLGFGHAGSSVCESTSNVDGARDDFGDDKSHCPTDEYGDYLDIMGYSISGALPHLSSAQRIRNGYLSAYRSIEGYTGTTTVKIGRLDGAASLRALKVVDPISGDAYYVEYRTPTGTDATSTEFTRDAKCTTTDDGYSSCSRSSSAATGAVRVIRELPYRSNGSAVKTTVLAVSDPSSKKRKTHLDAGESFTSADGGFTIVVNSLDISSGASISVRLGEAAQTETVLDIDESFQKYGSDARVKATAKVNRYKQAADSSALDGSVGFYSGSTRLAAVSLNSDGTAVYSLPATLAAGKRAITARYLPGTIADEPSVSESRVVTVTRASSTTKISLSSSKVSKKSRAKVTVKVSVSGATPTGTLSVYASGKKVAKATLSSSKKGKLTITLPKLTSTKSITVSYSGTSNIEGTQSSGKKLSVTR